MLLQQSDNVRDRHANITAAGGLESLARFRAQNARPCTTKPVEWDSHHRHYQICLVYHIHQTIASTLVFPALPHKAGGTLLEHIS